MRSGIWVIMLSPANWGASGTGLPSQWLALYLAATRSGRTPVALQFSCGASPLLAARRCVQAGRGCRVPPGVGCGDCPRCDAMHRTVNHLRLRWIWSTTNSSAVLASMSHAARYDAGKSLLLLVPRLLRASGIPGDVGRALRNSRGRGGRGRHLDRRRRAAGLDHVHEGRAHPAPAGRATGSASPRGTMLLPGQCKSDVRRMAERYIRNLPAHPTSSPPDLALISTRSICIASSGCRSVMSNTQTLSTDLHRPCPGGRGRGTAELGGRGPGNHLDKRWGNLQDHDGPPWEGVSVAGRAGRRGSVRQEDHGTWSFVVDVEDRSGRRKQTRRPGFASRRAAQAP